MDKPVRRSGFADQATLKRSRLCSWKTITSSNRQQHYCRRKSYPSWCLAIEHPKLNATVIAKKFRDANPPIIGRINDDRFLLDLRTIFNPEDVIPNFAAGGINE